MTAVISKISGRKIEAVAKATEAEAYFLIGYGNWPECTAKW